MNNHSQGTPKFPIGRGQIGHGWTLTTSEPLVLRKSPSHARKLLILTAYVVRLDRMVNLHKLF